MAIAIILIDTVAIEARFDSIIAANTILSNDINIGRYHIGKLTFLAAKATRSRHIALSKTYIPNIKLMTALILNELDIINIPITIMAILTIKPNVNKVSLSLAKNIVMDLSIAYTIRATPNI